MKQVNVIWNKFKSSFNCSFTFKWMDFQTNIHVLHLTKRWLALLKKNFFFCILALHYKTPYPRHVRIKQIQLLCTLFFLSNTENALILPSRVIFLMLSFTAGQHSPTCVGTINFKTQESSKEEDQRIHSFVLEILWGCHKIRTCTLFSLWHFFVHLEELCMLVHHRISRHVCSVRHHLRRYFCFFLI